MSPPVAAEWNDTSTISPIKREIQETMGGSKGMATIWTWRAVCGELKDFFEMVSSKHSGAKAAILIRPLVLKLPIDFHHSRSWASDQPGFLASTKAKLSYLEARSAFRDPHSPLTPAANLFPSGGSFFWWRQAQNFNTMVPLLMVLACNFLLPSVSAQFGSWTFASRRTAVAKQQPACVLIRVNSRHQICIKKGNCVAVSPAMLHKREHLLVVSFLLFS